MEAAASAPAASAPAAAAAASAPAASAPAAAKGPSIIELANTAGSSIKIAIVIVISIVVIYIVYTIMAFFRTNLGKASKKVLGTGATILTSMLDNPFSWLLAIGAIALFGPALLAMTRAAITRLFNRIRAAKGTVLDETPEAAELMVASAAKDAVVESTGTDPQGEAAQAAAEKVRAAADAAAAEKLPPEEKASVDDAIEKNAEDFPPPPEE